MPKVPKVFISLHCFQKHVEDEVDFLFADKPEYCVQVDSITLDVRSQTYQITQNNKFAISLQYLKENVKDEVDFFTCR